MRPAFWPILALMKCLKTPFVPLFALAGRPAFSVCNTEWPRRSRRPSFILISISGMTNFNLRRVLNPGLQQPFCPPRPKLPSEAIVLDSSYLTDLARMARQQNYTDLIFLCGTVGFSAHRFMMASASPLLRRILTADYDLHATSGATRSNSETSLVSRNWRDHHLLSIEDFWPFLSSEVNVKD